MTLLTQALQLRAEIKMQTQRGQGIRIKGNNKGCQVSEGLGTDIKIQDRQSEVKHIRGTRIQAMEEMSIQGLSIDIIHDLIKVNMLRELDNLRIRVEI